jgi:hypothetical protein
MENIQDQLQGVCKECGALMRFIKDGYGYWDTTYYPYGGDFNRAVGNVPITEILEEVGRRETRVKLANGHTAVVKNEFIGEE